MIHVLDEKLINKIAAGEVIDRPANVIKELVENAVDAGASHIVVEVSEDYIKVVDDGHGMNKEDIELSILRHATSKIHSFEDLEHVSSFGFRGEALSSIAAVSSFRILSKTEDMLEGYELCVEGGRIKSFRAEACPQGTVVEIRDLFFNTPVRKKFLDALEDERIVAFLEKFALGIPVAVRLRMHGKLVFDVQSLYPFLRESTVDFQAEAQTTYGISFQSMYKQKNTRFVRDIQQGLSVLPSFENRYVHFPELKILGNIAKTFFLAESEEGLVIIDQLVVEERINYEKFMKQYMKGEVVIQDLLVPELLEFSPKEAMLVRTQKEQLKSYGFYVEEFGENTFRLEKVPMLFNKVKGVEFLRDLLVDFKEEEKEDMITMMSCRKSIKAGDTILVSEIG